MESTETETNPLIYSGTITAYDRLGNGGKDSRLFEAAFCCSESVDDAASVFAYHSPMPTVKMFYQSVMMKYRVCFCQANERVGTHWEFSEPVEVIAIMRAAECREHAGLWDAWKDPSEDKWLQSFAIITTTPNALTATVHNRMPVILHPDDYEE